YAVLRRRAKHVVLVRKGRRVRGRTLRPYFGLRDSSLPSSVKYHRFEVETRDTSQESNFRCRPVAVLPLARKPPLIIARTDITGRGASVARLRLRDLDMILLESPVRSGVESHDGHRTPSVFRLKALAKHLADGLSNP